MTISAAVTVPYSFLSAIHHVDLHTSVQHHSQHMFENEEFMLSLTIVTLTSHASTSSTPIIVMLCSMNEELR